MKVLITLAFLWFFVAFFILGVLLGRGVAPEKENYFDSFPSPLACHVDNSCSLKDLQ